jgi:hypothetical protein
MCIHVTSVYVRKCDAWGGLEEGEKMHEGGWEEGDENKYVNITHTHTHTHVHNQCRRCAACGQSGHSHCSGSVCYR